MKSLVFDRRRFVLLLKRDAWMNGRTLLISLLAAAGGIVLLSFLDTLKMPGRYFHRDLYGGLLFLGGLVATSMMFTEMHGKLRNHAWLMLPASNFEKFLSRLLYSSVGYVAASVAVCFAASAVSEGINILVAGRSHPVFNPFDPVVGMKILNYFVLQSVYLFGAAFFRKHHFLKTLLTLIVGAIITTILLFMILRVFFLDFRGNLNWSFEITGQVFGGVGIDSADGDRLTAFVNAAKNVLIFLYWSAVGPLFWTLTYFRIRKVQVNHGV